MAFADSSALVKLYADEADSKLVREVPVLVVSAIARVEVPAALWRKSRTGELSVEDAAVLVQDFEADWTGRVRMLPIGLRADLLADAARLSGTHGLRAHDAVQLASARAARAADEQVDAFLCFDDELREAAVREGFAAASWGASGQQ